MANPKVMERSQPASEPEVEPQRKVVKTYYIPTEGLDVFYGPVVGDGVQNRVRGIISFARGMYQTDDPAKQEFLDKYPGCISAEQWAQIHIPAAEREAQKQRENERLQAENNRLMAELKRIRGGE